VVTVSRDHGSGGGEIARRLATRLGVRLFDKDLFKAIVEDAQIETYLLQQLDEHVQKRTTEWVHTLLTGHGAFKEDYRRHLVNVVLGIAEIGGVIVGRGANHILNQRNLFRLRVVGSPEVCARRVAERDGLEFEEALRVVEKVNAERETFVRLLFRRDVSDASCHDLVVNTDRLGLDDCVELAAATMERMELLKPAEA
jgi:cytidylate kinase